MQLVNLQQKNKNKKQTWAENFSLETKATLPFVWGLFAVVESNKYKYNIQILLSVAGLSVIMFNLSFKSRFWRLGYQEEKQKFKWITICVYVVCSIIQIKF